MRDLVKEILDSKKKEFNNRSKRQDEEIKELLKLINECEKFYKSNMELNTVMKKAEEADKEARKLLNSLN